MSLLLAYSRLPLAQEVVKNGGSHGFATTVNQERGFDIGWERRRSLLPVDYKRAAPRFRFVAKDRYQRGRVDDLRGKPSLS